MGCRKRANAQTDIFRLEIHHVLFSSEDWRNKQQPTPDRRRKNLSLPRVRAFLNISCGSPKEKAIIQSRAKQQKQRQ